jgi:hypothetical protein
MCLCADLYFTLNNPFKPSKRRSYHYFMFTIIASAIFVMILPNEIKSNILLFNLL